MGNCFERCSPKSQEEIQAEDFKKEEKSDEGVTKVRVVLTKSELEWLMQQLEQKPGKMSLEALIARMAVEESQWKEEERWQPALESILEVPEVQSIEIPAELDRRPLPMSPIG